jgi:hypothetical protein
VGGIFSALYTVVGAEVRRTVSTTSYTVLCYGTSGLALLLICLVARVDITGFSGKTWLQLLALTFGAQLLGHSLINRVLRTTSPTVVSLALPVRGGGGSGHRRDLPRSDTAVAALPAALLLLVGIGIVVSSRPRDVAPSIGRRLTLHLWTPTHRPDGVSGVGESTKGLSLGSAYDPDLPVAPASIVSRGAGQQHQDDGQGAGSAADQVFLDLEDAVAPLAKDERARQHRRGASTRATGAGKRGSCGSTT